MSTATPEPPDRSTLWKPRGRPDAARAIWLEADAASAPTTAGSDLRRAGGLRGIVGLILGILVLRFLHPIAGAVVLTLAGLTLLAALLSPTRIYRALHRGMERFAQAVGRVIGWLLLPPVYWLFFMPFGRLRRRGRHDRLRRGWEPHATSYWIERPPSPGGEAPYERQF